jgi:hypothetical protein
MTPGEIAWEEAEAAWDARVDAHALLIMVRRAQEGAMREGQRAERALVFAQRRARRAIRQLNHTTSLLETTCSLVSRERT